MSKLLFYSFSRCKIINHIFKLLSELDFRHKRKFFQNFKDCFLLILKSQIKEVWILLQRRDEMVTVLVEIKILEIAHSGFVLAVGKLECRLMELFIVISWVYGFIDQRIDCFFMNCSIAINVWIYYWFHIILDIAIRYVVNVTLDNMMGKRRRA